MEALHIKCRICDTLAEHRQYVAREMMFGTRQEFNYFLCSSCGCLQIADIPADLHRFYPDNYYSFQGGGKPRRDRARSRLRALLERLRAGNALFGRGYKLGGLAALVVDLPPEINPAGSLLKVCGLTSWSTKFLDIGCGSRSWWLSDLQALGFRNLVGADPYIERDTEDGDIKIFKAQIQDMAGQFDVISLHHSLEHMPDQIGTLRMAKARLTPRGHCLIRIPVVSSQVWEAYNTDWVELDAPRHLYLHSLKSIELLGRKAGLELLKTTWDSSAFEFYGSEQYRRNIPLNAENSYWRDPSRSDFTYREMAAFEALAATANREGRGGRGAFMFRSQDD